MKIKAVRESLSRAQPPKRHERGALAPHAS